MFGLNRRKRIAFLREFGDARLGRLTTRSQVQLKITFPQTNVKTGRGENVFGPQRRERILAELWKPPESSPELNRIGGPSLCKGLNI